MISPSPIHTDRSVQSIDVRLYFPVGISRGDLLNTVNEALGDSPHLSEMVSAYELVNDGFARLVPANKPLV